MAAAMINQRAEMRTAMGPGTANYAQLKSLDLQNGTNNASILKAILDKNVNDWSMMDTGFVASMFTLVVYGA